ncbi:hypothetical protein B0H13DRAFT_662583 [Mycena leptocephala]|nr:hypothetical protein B0H13DRAFT_662583 [Mycena leptocephala]
MGFSRDQLDGVPDKTSLTLSVDARRVGMQGAVAVEPAPSSTVDNMRRSTRITKMAKTSSNSVAAFTGTSHSTRPSTILQGCVVYVDVISDSGDDSAKSFIADMLRDMGAKVLSRVGHTLTHIVYKNGLGRTWAHYQGLPDPKPLVVGMEWVFQSAEKCTHVDETLYLIELDDMNTTTKKRPKSMLPRLMSGGLDDTYAITTNTIAPLEQARLRKAATLTI